VDETIKMVIPPCSEPQVVTVRLVDVRGNKARLGIEAPKAITVLRDDAKKTTSDDTVPVPATA
jgi:hypothetical protein